MDELIPSIEAVIKVFDTLGNRKNRHKARMKFVIDKLGFNEFKKPMGRSLYRDGPCAARSWTNPASRASG